jgi:heat shock protein HslJ
MKTRTMIQLIAILSIIILSACGGNGSGEEQLEGTSWVLTTINGERPADHTRLTIKFEDGNIFGECGSKSYSGLYLIAGDAIRLGVLDYMKTGCGRGSIWIKQEFNFIELNFVDLLEAAERFEVGDDILAIFTDDGQTLAFEKQ